VRQFFKVLLQLLPVYTELRFKCIFYCVLSLHLYDDLCCAHCRVNVHKFLPLCTVSAVNVSISEF